MTALRGTLTLALALVACAGCGDPAAPTPDELLAKSCAGERLDACEPYAYAIATSGTITPDMLRIGDLVADARVQASLRTCGALLAGQPGLRADASSRRCCSL